MINKDRIKKLYYFSHFRYSFIETKKDYFVTDCVVKQGNTEVSIIRDNCYSKTLGAKMSQSTHRVSVKSLFDWITFSSNTYQAQFEKKLINI